MSVMKMEIINCYRTLVTTCKTLHGVKPRRPQSEYTEFFFAFHFILSCHILEFNFKKEVCFLVYRFLGFLGGYLKLVFLFCCDNIMLWWRGFMKFCRNWQSSFLHYESKIIHHQNRAWCL